MFLIPFPFLFPLNQMVQERDTNSSPRPASRPVSSQSIQHRIIIESRRLSDIDTLRSCSPSYGHGSPVPATVDGSSCSANNNSKRPSIAAMALADELDNVSPQSNVVSHHITIERHFNNDSLQGSTLHGGSNLYNDNGRQSRSTIVVNLRDKTPDEFAKEDLSNLEKQIEQEKPTERPILRRLRAVRKFLFSLFVKYWFLLGLGVAIVLAWEFPQVGKTHGIVQSQYSVKYGAVIVIFLLSGLGIDVRVMLRTIMFWRLHLVIQTINFLAMPFVMYGIVLMFIRAGAGIDSSVYKGWIIALSTSTTVSSNVVMTRNAKGNDSGALVNAALGNVVGIFLCPALMSGKQSHLAPVLYFRD